MKIIDYLNYGEFIINRATEIEEQRPFAKDEMQMLSDEWRSQTLQFFDVARREPKEKRETLYKFFWYVRQVIDVAIEQNKGRPLDFTDDPQGTAQSEDHAAEGRILCRPWGYAATCFSQKNSKDECIQEVT